MADGREDPISLTPSEIRVIVIGAMLALFLAALDQTIVATALPPIANDLGDFALISWVVTAYLLTSTCATPIVGKLSDLYGRRRRCDPPGALHVGLTLCALARHGPASPSRGLQGLGGGGLMTLAQATTPTVSLEKAALCRLFLDRVGRSPVLGPMIAASSRNVMAGPGSSGSICRRPMALLVADRACALPVAFAVRQSTAEPLCRAPPLRCF
jgi:MFS family permease